MNGRQLIEECSAAGVKIWVRGERVSLEGNSELVAHYAELLRPHKDLIIACSSGLVDELMEDGLSQEEAEALALQSVPRLSPDEWVSMIAELDALIDDYCDMCKLSAAAKQRIHEARMHQSLATIPAALQWFRSEIGQRRPA